MIANPHHTTDVLKLFRRVVLLSVIVSCPRSFGIPISSLSPHKGSKKNACVVTVLWKEINAGIFILFSNSWIAPKHHCTLDVWGRKLRDRFPASNYFT